MLCGSREACRGLVTGAGDLGSSAALASLPTCAALAGHAKAQAGLIRGMMTRGLLHGVWRAGETPNLEAA